MNDWAIQNIGMLIGWAAAILSSLWALAVKFAKMEQKDEHQEERIKKLENEHIENRKLQQSNETRLVAVESKITSVQGTVHSIDKKLGEIQGFLMQSK